MKDMLKDGLQDTRGYRHLQDMIEPDMGIIRYKVNLIDIYNLDIDIDRNLYPMKVCLHDV